MAEIYLAFYKGNGPSFYDRMVDGAIRLFTKGEYYNGCCINLNVLMKTE